MNHQNMDILFSYGWESSSEPSFAPYRHQGMSAARIIREGRGLYLAICSEGTVLLEHSGTFRNLLDLGVQQHPVIGDWCAIRMHAPKRALLESVLPRKNQFSRPAAHEGKKVQAEAKPVAANIDGAVIVQDCAHDYNPRRIERFLSLLSAQQIPTILVLTKISLVADPQALKEESSRRFPGLHICLADSLDGRGIDELSALFHARMTYMLLGTSGAGKSTLVNALGAAEIAQTGAVRSQDGRGRHTTTARYLHLMPNGSLVLDTPGIRTVAVHGSRSEIDGSFADIAALATQCRYGDCTHTVESGCALLHAVAEGTIPRDRYEHFLRLATEALSNEELLRRSKEKKREIGRLQYRMRREGSNP